MKNLAILILLAVCAGSVATVEADAANRSRRRAPRKGTTATVMVAQPLRAVAVAVRATPPAVRATEMFCVKRADLWGASLELNEALRLNNRILIWGKSSAGKYLKAPFVVGPVLGDRNPSATSSSAYTLCAMVTGSK